MKIKLISSLSVAALLIISTSCSNKPGTGTTSTTDSASIEKKEQASAPSLKKYDLKSGIVTYSAKVMGMDNSQKLYFDDYGAKELHETITELSMMGVKTRKVSVELIKDGYRYIFDTENSTNNKDNLVKEIKKSEVLNLGSAGMGVSAAALTDEVKKQYDFKEEGTETVAGVSGTKFSMLMGKTRMTGVTYKKVMLKTAMEMITIIAEKFEENASIPSEKFELPKDYKIIEVQ